MIWLEILFLINVKIWLIAHAYSYEERDRLNIRGFLMNNVPVWLIIKNLEF